MQPPSSGQQLWRYLQLLEAGPHHITLPSQGHAALRQGTTPKPIIPITSIEIFYPDSVKPVCQSFCQRVWVFLPQDLFEPQTGLLRYVLEQPYSRDMVCNMLGLNKQVHLLSCPALSALPFLLYLPPCSWYHRYSTQAKDAPDDQPIT